MALAFPLSRFASRAGGGSAFFVRPSSHIVCQAGSKSYCGNHERAIAGCGRTCHESRGISDKVRAAFLLHGSTSESWPAVEHIQWSTENNVDSIPIRRGITCDGVFLTDLFQDLESGGSIPSHLASKYPGLSPDGYREALRVIWLVLSECAVVWGVSLGRGQGRKPGPRRRAAC